MAFGQHLTDQFWGSVFHAISSSKFVNHREVNCLQKIVRTTHIIEIAFESFVWLHQFSQVICELQGLGHGWLEVGEAVLPLKLVARWFCIKAQIKVSKVVDVAIENSGRKLCGCIVHWKWFNLDHDRVAVKIRWTYFSRPTARISLKLRQIYQNVADIVLKPLLHAIAQMAVGASDIFGSKHWQNLKKEEEKNDKFVK